MKKLLAILCLSTALLSACGKPSDMSDEEYNKYKDFGAPKILFSCTVKCGYLGSRDEIGACLKEEKTFTKTTSGYYAGIGPAATYNKILGEAKGSCGGEFKIIDKKA